MATHNKKTITKISLNLLYPQGIPEKLPVKFIKWLISYGRFIVIVVEVIVLACFAYRFKLDADLADLKEQINNQVPYLESLTVDEALIVQTQQRLKYVQNVDISTKNWSNIFSHISSQTPVGIKLTNLNIEKKTPSSSQMNFKLTANTNSNNDLALLLGSLKQDVFFTNVSLASVSFEQGLITFSITGGTK